MIASASSNLNYLMSLADRKLTRDEVDMGIQEFGAPPVTRLAVPIDVAGSIAQALRHRGFRVVHTSPAPRTSADHSISVLSLSGAADFSSNNAVILILGADSTQSLFAGRTTCASQRRLKAYENHAHESAVVRGTRLMVQSLCGLGLMGRGPL